MAAAGSRDEAERPSRPARKLGRGPVSALETLADLGVVELGTDDSAGGLTVALSRLGVWGMHRHLRAQGWHVPVLGSGARDGAAALLTTLASCDAEDGEAEDRCLAGGTGPGEGGAGNDHAAGAVHPACAARACGADRIW